jgi:hypothetical protein
MTFERLKHIRAFLEAQRSVHGVGPDAPANYPVKEWLLSPLGLHVAYSYELADAIEKLMCGQSESNPEIETSGNYKPGAKL